MAFQIPKGDNLGNVSPQVGRTRIYGGDSPIGQAMMGFGRDVQRIGLQLEQEKEQVNQVEMRNAVLNREKQVNSLKNSIDERVKMGDLDPESAVEEYKKQLATLPKQEIKGLNGKQQETLNYYYNATDYQGEQQALGIYKQGITVKAQTAVSEAIRLINEDPNADIDKSLAIFDTEPMKASLRTGWGPKADEVKAQLKRDLLLNNLQNKATIAADNSDYKTLKQFKSDVMNGDYYTGILQNDDRVKLAHNAKLAMKRMESEWKAAQAESLVNLQYKIQDDSAKIEAGLDVPDPLTEDQIRAARPSNPAARERFDRQIQSYKETLQLQPVLVDVVRGTPEEALTAINSIKPNADDENFALKQQRYNFVMSRYQQTLQAREKDPAGWLVQNNESVQKAFQAYTEDSANGAALATAVEAQKQIYGISSDKLLPENVNNALIKQIEKNPTVSNIRSISASFGQYAPKILGQIQSKGGDAIAVAVGLEDEQASDLLLKHKDIPIKDIAKTISKTDYDSAIKGLSDNISAARTSFAMQPDGLKTLSAINSQLEKLAVIYTTKGMSPAEAAKKAAESINNQYDFNNTWRVPKHLNLNSSDIEDGAAYYVKTLKTNYISPFGGDNRLGNAVLLKQTLSRIQSNAEFITNKDETGLILTVDGIPVRDDKGNLIDISYTSLSIMGREHRSNWRIDARAEQSKFLAKKTTQEEKDAVFYKALEASLYTP